jgi:hypothetical protein
MVDWNDEEKLKLCDEGASLITKLDCDQRAELARRLGITTEEMERRYQMMLDWLKYRNPARH